MLKQKFEDIKLNEGEEFGVKKHEFLKMINDLFGKLLLSLFNYYYNIMKVKKTNVHQLNYSFPYEITKSNFEKDLK